MALTFGPKWGPVANAFGRVRKYQPDDMNQNANYTGYTEAPAYMDVAKKMLPTPTPLSERAGYSQATTAQDLTKLPQYGQATQKVNLSSLPQYGAASQKTTIDPKYWQNQWNLAEGDINQSYMKKGGLYDRMLEGLNERGLLGSGEQNMQTTNMTESMGKELAKARLGLETERMGQQAGLDESFANRMSGLLGQQAGFDQSGINNMMGLLGTQAGLGEGAAGRLGSMLGTQFGMDWQGGLGQAGLAGQLAGARNQITGDVADRDLNRVLGEYTARNQMFGDIANWAGQAGLDDSDQNMIASMLGFPIQEAQGNQYAGGFTQQPMDFRYAGDQQRGRGDFTGVFNGWYYQNGQPMRPAMQGEAQRPQWAQG